MTGLLSNSFLGSSVDVRASSANDRCLWGVRARQDIFSLLM